MPQKWSMNRLPITQMISIAGYKLRRSVYQTLTTYCARLTLWRYGVTTGNKFKSLGLIRCINRGKLIIGNNVTINSGALGNFVGGDRRTNFWVGPHGTLEIDDNVGISNSTIIARSSIRIHNHTLIGGGCDIYDNDFHELHAIDRLNRTKKISMAPIEIGPHAFVGAHTIVLKGVKIGEGAVVGAGSLVTQDIPPYEVWAGQPARCIKKLDPVSLQV